MLSIIHGRIGYSPCRRNSLEVTFNFFFSNKHVGFKFLNLSMKLGKTVKANLNIPSHA